MQAKSSKYSLPTVTQSAGDKVNNEPGSWSGLSFPKGSFCFPLFCFALILQRTWLLFLLTYFEAWERGRILNNIILCLAIFLFLFEKSDLLSL